LLSDLDYQIKQHVKNIKEELMAAKRIGWISWGSDEWVSSLCGVVFSIVFEVLVGR